MEEEKDRSVLALSDAYELEAFIPVKESSSDKDTTISDVAMLNNHLAVSNLALSQVRTIAGLCALSNAVCKLIEVRRKVKKLPYGEQSASKGGRVFEVIE